MLRLRDKLFDGKVRSICPLLGYFSTFLGFPTSRFRTCTYSASTARMQSQPLETAAPVVPPLPGTGTTSAPLVRDNAPGDEASRVGASAMGVQQPLAPLLRPPFAISPDAVLPIATPHQYHSVLLRLARTARRSISCALYYTTTNRREQELFRAMATRARQTAAAGPGQQLQLRVLVDFLRTLAPSPTSKDTDNVGGDPCRTYKSSAQLLVDMLRNVPDPARAHVGLLLLPQSRHRSRRVFAPVAQSKMLHLAQIDAIDHVKVSDAASGAIADTSDEASRSRSGIIMMTQSRGSH